MIEERRKEVDRLDAQLVKLLAQRMELSLKIGQEKQAQNLPVFSKTREIAVLDTVKLLADSLGLSEAFIVDVYSLIFAESRRLQQSA